MNEQLKIPEGAKHIHLVGVGGIGVSALAPPLLERGFTVSGSDPAANDVTERLEQLGVTIVHEHRPENVEGASLVVATAAAKPDHVELKRARELGIPVWHRAQMLGYLMQESKSIVITGAHGKTTTTGMAAKMLVDAGYDPSAFIGGDVVDFNGNVRTGKGGWVVAEGDESDGSFIHFHPDYAIVNNIDADHLDHYHNLQAIIDEFKKFLAGTKPGCVALLSADCEHTRALEKQVERKTLTYGFSEGATIRGIDYRMNGSGWRCEVQIEGKPAGTLKLQLHGNMNYHNALSVIALAHELGIPFETASSSLAGFRGVKRRMEVKGTTRGVTVLDDYAHHPAEIRATVAALKEKYSGGLIGVFQPHLYSRTEFLLNEFSQAFDGLDLLVVTDIYAAREEKRPGVTGELLVTLMRRGSVPVLYIPRLEEIPAFLNDVAGEGDSVVTIGAGNVWKVGERFLQGVR